MPITTLLSNEQRKETPGMKKAIAFLLLLSVCVSLFGACGKKEVKNVDLDALLDSILAKYNMVDGFVYTSTSTELGEYLDEDLIISCYGDAGDAPDFTKVESYCVYMDDSDPTVIIDTGVFKMADPSYADTFMKYLHARIDFKIKDGEIYTDIDVAMLKTAVVAKTQNGAYVYYVVSYDVKDISAELAEALG